VNRVTENDPFSAFSAIPAVNTKKSKNGRHPRHPRLKKRTQFAGLWLDISNENRVHSCLKSVYNCEICGYKCTKVYKSSQKFTKMHKNRPKASNDCANPRQFTSEKQRKRVYSSEFVVDFEKTKPIGLVLRIA